MPMMIEEEIYESPTLAEDSSAAEVITEISYADPGFTFAQAPEIVSPMVLLVLLLAFTFMGACSVAEAFRGGHPWVGFVPAMKIMAYQISHL
jgi:hypothetical protein